MHPYLESLKRIRDKRYENFHAPEQIGPVLAAIGLALGVANSYTQNYSPIHKITLPFSL